MRIYIGNKSHCLKKLFADELDC